MVSIQINSGFWDYDFVQKMNPNGSIVIVKENYRFADRIKDWLVERGYPYETDDRTLTITFEDFQHAFDFKVRWL